MIQFEIGLNTQLNFDNISSFDNGFCMALQRIRFLASSSENKGDTCMTLGICKS